MGGTWSSCTESAYQSWFELSYMLARHSQGAACALEHLLEQLDRPSRGLTSEECTILSNFKENLREIAERVLEGPKKDTGIGGSLVPDIRLTGT